MGPVGEIRLVPDPDTFRVLPYAPRTGAMLVDQRRSTASPAPVDQRAFLRRMADRLAERGARLEVAFENEFALAVRDDERRRTSPIDASLCFSTIGMTAAQDYVDALVDGARGAGDPARAVLRRARPRPAGDLDRPPPGAPGRRRAAPRPRDDPRRAPQPTGSSPRWPRSRGPRRPATAATSTSRCGTSTAERNRFHDPRRADGFSAEGRAFLAGVLEHLPGLCGLTAPSFNSYRRIVPQYWAGAFTCWGHDNREAPLRLPSVFRGHGGGVDQRRAQGGGRDLQPVPRGRRADRGRARRPRARARAARARSRSTRPRSPRTSASAAASAGCPPRRRRRSTRSRPTPC